MTDSQDLIQETIVSRLEEKDESYVTALAAYIDNPFHDMTQAAIADYVAKKNPPTEAMDTETPVEI